MRLQSTSRALVAVLLVPGTLWAQFKPVPVGAESAAGLGNSGVAGANTTPAGSPGLGTSYYGPNVSLTNNNGAFAAPRAVVPGANPSASAAAAVNPQVALPSPAAVRYNASPSVEAAPGARADMARPQARSAAPSSMLPGALPSFDDPARRTPEGGSGGMSTVQNAVKDLAGAKKAEAGGVEGAVSGRLDALFDFSQTRPGTSIMPDGASRAEGSQGTAVQGLPDPKVVGVEPALGKVSALARRAEPGEAAALYGRAVEIANEGLPPAQASVRTAAIRPEAAARAPAAVQGLVEKAVAAAAQGRTTDAIRYAKGVHGWNALLASGSQPYIENLPEMTGTVKHVLRSALETPGKAAAAPKVRIEAVSRPGRDALRARFKFADQKDAPVAAVPAAFAEGFVLPELKGFVALEGPSAPEGPSLAAAFAMRPQAGFSSVYRQARSRGDSAWRGFWVAARSIVAGTSLTLWDQLKAFVLQALQALGILHSAVASGPMVEPVSPQALAGLRALAPERAERQPLPAAAPDALGLGYRLISGR
ncbi:MAG: hypothetical protein HY928_14910 [Elusimicrobia bacterium]|nr:hypothetical protein [Elusimicrobiota bacterium]